MIKTRVHVLFLTKVFDTWEFIVNLKTTDTAAAIAALTNTVPSGAPSLANPALYVLYTLFDNTISYNSI